MSVLTQVADIRPGTAEISIVDQGYVPYRQWTLDVGPELGSILNAHFFPGIADHAGGYYSQAEREFTYVILRPSYFEDNPRQGEFMSTAHYLRGSIYVDHAVGLGRYVAAKDDFESAIMWNSRNYPAYLALGRVYETLGFPREAITVLEELLDMNPEAEIVESARTSLNRILEMVSSEVVRDEDEGLR